MLDWLNQLDLALLYPVGVVLIAGAAEIGNVCGRRFRSTEQPGDDLGTLTGAALGLLALLLAFSFSIALARFDSRRDLVLSEANAIGTTANYALMLPQPEQGKILALLRDYTRLRVSLGIPYDPARFDRDIARSVELQQLLWQQAMAATAAAPQSLPAYRFVASLNEMNNIHESRVTALRYHVPNEVMFLLLCVAMVALGFTGYHAGVSGASRRVPNLIMAVTISVLVMLVIDLDRPTRGVIQVPNQPLIDAGAGLPPP